MEIEVDLPDAVIESVPTTSFKVRGRDGKPVKVIIRVAYGDDMVESTKGSNSTLAPSEQLLVIIARVTSLDGQPATMQALKRLPLAAVTKITREFNKVNGEDPLEDSTE